MSTGHLNSAHGRAGSTLRATMVGGRRIPGADLGLSIIQELVRNTISGPTPDLPNLCLQGMHGHTEDGQMTLWASAACVGVRPHYMQLSLVPVLATVPCPSRF